MSIDRKRLTPEASRSAALVAARHILVTDGPQALTLKAVATQIGRTHANLLHHFGSAAGLQKALAETMAESICAEIGATVMRARRGEADPRAIVDMTFDAFDGGGAGALATWMMLSGDRQALAPILSAIHNLVEELAAGHEGDSVAEDTLTLILTALGDALLGKPMADALGLPRDAAREIAYKQLLASPGIQARMKSSALVSQAS